MKINRAYKTELRLNNKQKTLCFKSAGIARFAYNWGLRQKIDLYKSTGKSPSAIDLHRKLNTLKKSDYPWMYEVSKCAPQESLRNLDTAFRNFFRNGNKGFPKFKSRHRGVGSFKLTGSINVENNRIRIPKIGWIRLKESDYLPTETKIISTTVSEKAGHWFVSVQVEKEVEQNPTDNSTGVDVGVSHLATLSDGTNFDNPKALRSNQKRLRLLQKSVSRKTNKLSNNRKKAVLKVRKQHYRISCIRKDASHKSTTAITKLYGIIGIESLNVAGMLKDHSMAKSLSDAAMSEFLRQLKYKSEWNGCKIVEAPRFYPSSKTCNRCGNIQNMPVKIRTYRCGSCDLVMDRDLNAAINLNKIAVSSTVTACGDSSDGGLKKSSHVSLKQESNTG